MGLKAFIEKYAQTVGERTEVDELMTLTLFFQSIFAHQVLDPKWTWKKKYIHQFLNLGLIIYVFFGTMDIIKNTSDAQLKAEAYYTIVLVIVCPWKLILFITNRNKFRKLYLMSKTKLFDIVKNDSKEKIRDVLKKGKIAVYTLFVMVGVPVMTYELGAMWNYVNGNRILLSRSTSTLMPMTTPYYEVAWFLHSMFLFLMSSIMLVMDMCFVFLMFFFCVASDCLVKMLEVESKRDAESKREYEKRLNQSLRKFYKAHLDLVEYLNTANMMYRWLALVPLCNAALCMCSALVVFSKAVNWRFRTLFLPLFAEIFAYSWFGEQIKTKTTDIKLALLNFDWTHLSINNKRSYYIMMTYMTKEFGIKTAIGNDLSMITMTTVLKFSYQAYTVLQSVE